MHPCRLVWQRRARREFAILHQTGDACLKYDRSRRTACGPRSQPEVSKFIELI